jgi:hypothetical protein
VHRRFVPRTHSNALRDPQIVANAKHKFGVMCLDTLFVEFVPVPHKHEKSYIVVSRPKCTVMHYVARVSHDKHKQKFGVMCPGVLLEESVPVPLEHEK